jgi:hypothetical protein
MVLHDSSSVATHFVHTSQRVINNWVLGYCNFAGVGCAENFYFCLVFFLWLEYVGIVPENQQS